MLVKAKIENHNEWLFLEELPDNYSPGHHLSEKLVTIKDLSVGMNNYQISTNGLFILYSEMKFGQSSRILTEVEGEAVACQFIFSNQIASKQIFKLNKLARSRHNIRYIPSSRESHEVKPGVDYVYFLIVLSKDYYLRLVDLHSPLNEKFIREMEKGLYTSFAGDDFVVTPEMRKSIADIRFCKQGGELKRLHTDARVLELIMYQLEQFSTFTDEVYEFKEDDIAKLEEAREILERQYINPPTQKQLSKLVFLNEFKLRSGFKRYYGSTIYDFITGLRMKEARKLILEDRCNMYEVGILVGFKHQGSFTHAFKKYYGILPSEVRY